MLRYRWLIVGLVWPVVTFWFNAPSSAEPPVADSAANKARWPKSLTATVGDVSVRIDGPKLWTLSRIEHAGALLGVEDSAYGTVVQIRDVGFIGTAHLEVEPEQVDDLQFFVDDQPLTALTEVMKVQGKSFRLNRDSKIRALRLKSELRVADDRILQSVRITSEREVDLRVMYPFMYAWTPTATNFLFGADDGQEVAGDFLSEKPESPRYLIEKSVRWLSVYDPTSRQGTVSYVVTVPPKVEGWLMLADAPQVYRKLYLVCFSDLKVPEGFDGTFKMVTGFFTAEPGRWQSAARSKATEFKGLLEKLK